VAAVAAGTNPSRHATQKTNVDSAPAGILGTLM
jgi:hypothetical protein